MSIAVHALLEAARRCRLIDQAMGKRLAASAVGVHDIAGLARFLAGPEGPGGQLAGRLGALLAPPGITFGPWLPQARLLDGSTGEAWLASDDARHLGLLRVLPASDFSARGDNARAAHRRFLRQFDVCRQLNHPNLVSLLGNGDAPNGGLWFTVEYTDSGDLSDLLRLHGGRLAEMQTLGLGAQISAALAELDRLGLVHLAIAPASILVAADGSTKLGNLFQVRNGTTSDNTSRSTLMMTHVHGESDSPWMSPEAVLGTEEADIRSDVYALGCVLFSCLAGRPPFTGASPEVMHGHATATPPDLRSLRPDIDGALAEVISACLAKSPARRPEPKTLHDILFAIRVRLGKMGDSARRTPVPSSTRHRRQLSLSGDFATVPMNEVLQTLARVKASGILRISDPDGHDQRLVIQDGEPVGLDAGESELAELAERLADVPGLDLPRVRARLAGGSTPAERLIAIAEEGLVAEEALIVELSAQLFDAITRCFLDHAGSFDFTGDNGKDVTVEQALTSARRLPLKLNPNHLLMEAARQLDEWTALGKRLPGPWALPLLDPDKFITVRTQYGLWPERAILATIDGSTPLGGVLAHASATPCAALRLIATLAEQGHLSFVQPQNLLARTEEFATNPLAAEPYARAALVALPGDDRAGLAFARCLAAAEPEQSDDTALFDTNPTLRLDSNEGRKLTEAISSTPAPAPRSHMKGRLEDACSDDWLALLSAPDGSGSALHVFAADVLTEVQIGKLAKPPVHISLRKYPEKTYLAESQKISRIHCSLTLSEDRASLRDVGAANGTWLDGAQLAANADMPLVPGRDHMVQVAGVVGLRLRVVRLLPDRQEPIQTLAAADAPEPLYSALTVERMGNRSELGYALVRYRLSIGGAGADFRFNGASPGAHFVLSRCAGRWLWAAAEDLFTWQPLILGQSLSVGGLTLRVVTGGHQYYH